jgi:hypothetical protein
MKAEYAIIVKSPTRLEQLTNRFNTQNQAAFYIRQSGGNFDDYELEHHNFQESLLSVQKQLSSVLKNKIVERNYLPSYLFNEKNLIIVIGQDGLVANTAKYAAGIPIIAVNPDIDRYDGVLLPFTPENFLQGVENVLAGRFNARQAPLAEASLNDGQRLIAFNDLFIGVSSHVSARYRISFHNSSEDHSSSGIIVSTKSGSTGWLSSIFNMNNALNRYSDGNAYHSHINNMREDELMFVVREPFISKRTQANLAIGTISGHELLTVESYMPQNGVIFSDGIESDFLQFNSGSIAKIGKAKEKANLVLPD